MRSSASCSETMRWFGVLTAIFVATVVTAPHASAVEKIEGLKFSKPEIELLKRINQIQSGAHLASTMLKAAPFVQLFGSPNPIDVAITITTNDWDLILSSLGALKKIESCKTVEEIDLWNDVDGNKYSSLKTKAFFDQLRSHANSRC